MRFKVSANEAAALRRYLEEKIRSSHLAINGSYEEGVIDTIAWLFGETAYVISDKKHYGTVRKTKSSKAEASS